MLPTRARLPIAAAVLVTACGGGGVADPGVVGPLADRVDRVAELAEAGEDCEALTELDGFVTAVDEAHADGALPTAAVEELAAPVQRIADGLDCAPPDGGGDGDGSGGDGDGGGDDDAADDDGDDDDDGGKPGKGKGRDRGGGDG